MNDLTNPPSQRLTIAYSAQAELGAELAKILMLVAPISMSVEQHELWLRSAVGALDGIRADEVRAILFELQRKVTRPAQIVPEVANLVAAKRARSRAAQEPAETGAWKAETIHREAQAMRHKAKGQDKIESAWDRERSERKANGLPVRPLEKPLSRDELDSLPRHIKAFGVGTGFLKMIDGKLVEA